LIGDEKDECRNEIIANRVKQAIMALS